MLTRAVIAEPAIEILFDYSESGAARLCDTTGSLHFVLSSGCILPVYRRSGGRLMDKIFLSIVLPCLNEARTLSICVRKAQAYIASLAVRGLEGEVIVADNGSTDGSHQLAQSLGARLVHATARGYGNALQAGIKSARGKYIIMGDSDDSYDFLGLDAFVVALEAGNDFVIGNRFSGGIEEGAMPPLHRYFGNPFLTLLGRLFFKTPVHDFYCGLRGFNRAAILGLGLRSPGMEFALEMIIKASIHGLRIAEVPTTLSRDGRDRAPHLRSWRDGWRSLRLYLLMCPRWLFLYPGLCLALVGGTVSLVLLYTNVQIGQVRFAYHSLILTSAVTSIGVQSVFFWVFARGVAVEKGFLLPDALYGRLRRAFALERCLAFGAVLILIGLGSAFYSLFFWYELSFGEIQGESLIKVICAASLLTVLGFQLIFSSFFLYLLDQPTETAEQPDRTLYSIRPAGAE
jgi:glycosyltransferase involved in cell wall biosynthesis